MPIYQLKYFSHKTKVVMRYIAQVNFILTPVLNNAKIKNLEKIVRSWMFYNWPSKCMPRHKILRVIDFLVQGSNNNIYYKYLSWYLKQTKKCWWPQFECFNKKWLKANQSICIPFSNKHNVSPKHLSHKVRQMFSFSLLSGGPLQW